MLLRNLIFLLMLCLTGCSHDSKKVYSGYVEGRFTYVSSQTSGVLQKLFVSKGEQVQKNVLLFQLEPDPELADFNQAKSRLKEAKANLMNLAESKRPTEIAAIKAQQKQVQAQLNFALKTVNRIKILNKKNYESQQRLDQSISDVNLLKAKLSEISKNLKTSQLSFGRKEQVTAAEANVEATKAILNKITWKLSQTKINAPVFGRVFDTFYRVGEVVPAYHSVLALLSPKNIYAVFYVSEKQFSTLKIGQPVKVTCDSCEKAISAKINYISPIAEYTPQVFYTKDSRSKFVFRVEAKFSEQDAKYLLPGQPIDIRI